MTQTPYWGSFEGNRPKHHGLTVLLHVGVKPVIELKCYIEERYLGELEAKEK